jgi:hypothetical protein
MVFSARSKLALTHHGLFRQVNGAMVRCDKTSRVFRHRGNSFATSPWARKVAPTLRRNFAGGSMIRFSQIRKDRDAPHSNFKLPPMCWPGILMINALTAKRPSDGPTTYLVLMLTTSHF